MAYIHQPQRILLPVSVAYMALTVVLALRGLSLREYFATLDPVSGTVYYALLLAFALMPLIVERR